jgi:hypothetical protein
MTVSDDGATFKKLKMKLILNLCLHEFRKLWGKNLAEDG